MISTGVWEEDNGQCVELNYVSTKGNKYFQIWIFWLQFRSLGIEWFETCNEKLKKVTERIWKILW